MIKLSAHHQEIEQSRISRLRDLADECAKKDFPIGEMHDHKGTLHVNWTEAPRTEQLVEVVRLWRAQAEHQSSHYVNGKLLIADYESHNPFADTTS